MDYDLYPQSSNVTSSFYRTWKQGITNDKEGSRNKYINIFCLNSVTTEKIGFNNFIMNYY